MGPGALRYLRTGYSDVTHVLRAFIRNHIKPLAVSVVSGPQSRVARNYLRIDHFTPGTGVLIRACIALLP